MREYLFDALTETVEQQGETSPTNASPLKAATFGYSWHMLEHSQKNARPAMLMLDRSGVFCIMLLYVDFNGGDRTEDVIGR